MFTQLTDRLVGVFDRMRGRGILSENDVDQAMRDIRIALLEADVALPVVKTLVAQIKEKAVGEDVVRSVAPAQMVVKIVHDHLVDALGGENETLNLSATPPVVLLLVGVQGSGKTTTAAKLAKRLVKRDKKRVLLASLDIHRPAAQEQLASLADQSGIPCLDIQSGETAREITQRALKRGRAEGCDVIILDSAGRLSVDDAMMAEAREVSQIAQPKETLLVADAMTGQDAVRVATAFHQHLTLTGLILTRVDGDARGGAALSMRSVTGCPVKFIGVGEKIDDLEAFHPERIASRILGMGDVVSLVEKTTESLDQEKAAKIARKIQKGRFDFNDLAEQLGQMEKTGNLQDILSMIPGLGKMGKIRQQAAQAGIDENMIKHQKALISSMTPGERRRPEIIKASRKRRIAAGCGLTVQDLNRLLKQHKQMSQMMKRFGKLGPRQLRELTARADGGFPGMPGMPAGKQPWNL